MLFPSAPYLLLPHLVQLSNHLAPSRYRFVIVAVVFGIVFIVVVEVVFVVGWGCCCGCSG